MRIAFLTNDYPKDEEAGSTQGGAGRVAAYQVRLLRAAGHEVRVWHVPPTWITQTPWQRLLRHWHDRLPRPELVREILEWKPEFLITHNLTGCGFGTPQQIQKQGVTWMHVLHDVQLFEPSGQMRSVLDFSIWQVVWTWIRQSVFGHPDIVVSPTEWLLRKHRRREFFLSPDTECEVIPNPAAPFQLSDRNIHRPFQLLFVGRVSTEKGSRFLARLIPLLLFPVELHVVGEEEDVEELKALGSVVVWHGKLPEEAVHDLMRRANVLLVPSLIEENQPNVILEAASLGLPVIASRKGGIPETMAKVGIVCPANHVSSWKRSLQELYQDEAYYKHVIAGMELIARLHDEATYRQRFLTLVRSKR